MRSGRGCAFALLAIGVGVAGAASAQKYPVKPVRMIVPFAPGGNTDIIARIVAPKMSENLGQQIVIDNRGGAGSVIGTELAARAPADGYVLLMVSAAHTINPAMASDPSRLVVYQTLPTQTPAGDSTRAQLMLDRLTTTSRTFPSSTGIGSAGARYSGSIASFAQRVVEHRGAEAESARQLDTGQNVALSSVQARFAEDAAVNIDVEMAQLTQLQNAYAANARVLAAAKEMLDMLMPVIIVLPGIAAVILAPNLAKPDEAYPSMMRLLPTGLLGLVFAALIAAIIASTASKINSIATIFTLDVFAKFRPVRDGGAGQERKLVMVGRIAATVSILLAILTMGA